MENIHFDIYNNLTEIQNILCNLCGNVLFVKNNYVPEDFDLGELFTDTEQVWEPKSSARRLEDGTIVSPPLEDLAPFLSREELKENMFIEML